MAQINLLKQVGGGGSYKDLATKVILPIFLAVLVIVLGYYVYLFVNSNNLNKNISNLQQKITSDVQATVNSSSRAELLTRQQQLQVLKGLIANHVYWSQLFPKLAQVTLSKATYSAMQIDAAENSLSLNVTVPTLADLDKYLQVFNLPDVNKNFYNVSIGGFNNVQGNGSSEVQFQVKMFFDPSLISLQPN